jgi:hypothetical protein
MRRYLIQLTHSKHHDACVRALDAIVRYGGHLVTNAEWGCKVGVHSGWAIVEVENLDQAVQMVPPEFREDATIVELSKFTTEEIQAWVDGLDV